MRTPVRQTCTCLLAALLAAAGCARIPFEPVPLTATPPRTAAELAAGVWSAGPGVYRLRHSGMLAFGWKRVPLTGFMEVDTGLHRARLVGMDDMGLKAFDLTVTPTTCEIHYQLPGLPGGGRVPAAVADSVRHLYLDPLPSAADELETRADTYRLRRQEGRRHVRFVLGGNGPTLLESTGSGPGEDWRVRYYRFQNVDGQWVPHGAVYDDGRTGLRLVLWTESVRRVRE